MVSGSTRIAGVLAILIGFIISLTVIGALIGIPLIIIGFILLLPELFVPLIIIGIILLLWIISSL